MNELTKNYRPGIKLLLVVSFEFRCAVLATRFQDESKKNVRLPTFLGQNNLSKLACWDEKTLFLSYLFMYY